MIVTHGPCPLSEAPLDLSCLDIFAGFSVSSKSIGISSNACKYYEVHCNHHNSLSLSEITALVFLHFNSISLSLAGLAEHLLLLIS